MLFNSLLFFAFFTIVLILYYASPKKYRYIVLLISSYCFYAYSNYKYVFLLLFVTVISYTGGLLFSRKRDCRFFLILQPIFLEIKILIYFKYMSFILYNISKLTALDISIQNIVVPLGISFFILQAISYPIDVYRRDVEVEKNFLKFALFISFIAPVSSKSSSCLSII